MAGKLSRELTMKINVDVSEALTGLKAVQREAREATKALRELEAEKGPKLSDYTTKELIRELTGRTGVMHRWKTDSVESIPDGFTLIVEDHRR